MASCGSMYGWHDQLRCISEVLYLETIKTFERGVTLNRVRHPNLGTFVNFLRHTFNVPVYRAILWLRLQALSQEILTWYLHCHEAKELLYKLVYYKCKIYNAKIIINIHKCAQTKALYPIECNPS